MIDTNGEQPLTGMIVEIESVGHASGLPWLHGADSFCPQSEEGLVTTLDETRHGLEDGDYVTFTEVKGMDGLNSSGPRKVTVKGAHSKAC